MRNEKIKLLLVATSSEIYRFVKDAEERLGNFSIEGFSDSVTNASLCSIFQNFDIIIIETNKTFFKDPSAILAVLRKRQTIDPVILLGKVETPNEKRLVEKFISEHGFSYFISYSDESSEDVGKLTDIMQFLVAARPIIRKNKNANGMEFVKKHEKRVFSLIAIGASTGGPEAINSILSKLPANFKYPIVIAQHIMKDFDENFREFLLYKSKLPITLISEENKKIYPGNIYLSLGGKNIVFSGKDIIHAEKAAEGKKENLPSVSLFFESVFKYYRGNAVCILLSGMGKDGADALKKLKEAGAYTIAQDEASCVVYGMPGEAVRINAAEHIYSIEQIVNFLRSI